MCMCKTERERDEEKEGEGGQGRTGRGAGGRGKWESCSAPVWGGYEMMAGRVEVDTGEMVWGACVSEWIGTRN